MSGGGYCHSLTRKHTRCVAYLCFPHPLNIGTHIHNSSTTRPTSPWFWHDWIPQIQGVGQSGPDLAQLLSWSRSHRVSGLCHAGFTGGSLLSSELRES